MDFKTTLVLNGLERLLGQPVFLTGSCFFETNHRYSDIDVFTQATLEIAQKLEESGFTLLAHSRTTYSDSNTEGVFHLYGIDVQCVKEVPLKLAAQDYLKTQGMGIVLARLSKIERKKIWNMAFDVVRKVNAN